MKLQNLWSCLKAVVNNVNAHVNLQKDKQHNLSKNTGTSFISYDFDCKTKEFKLYRVAFSGY